MPTQETSETARPSRARRASKVETWHREFDVAVVGMGAGTPLQMACGFQGNDDEKFTYLVASCSPHADEEKILRFCEGSAEHYHWLTQGRHEGIACTASDSAEYE